jgi:hypothetical protein
VRGLEIEQVLSKFIGKRNLEGKIFGTRENCLAKGSEGS